MVELDDESFSGLGAELDQLEAENVALMAERELTERWIKRLYVELVNLATAPTGTTFPSWILNGQEFAELRRRANPIPESDSPEGSQRE